MAQEEDIIDRGDFIEDDDSEEIEELEEEEDTSEGEEEDTDEGDDEDSSDEETEDEEEESPKKQTRVPKSRLDEVIRQREEARDRSAWLEEQLEKLIANQTAQQKKEQQAPPESTYDFDAAEEAYINLIIEGDTAKAAKLRQEITREQNKQFQSLLADIENKAVNKAKGESTAHLESERFLSAIESMEVKYPFLDNHSKQYNEEAVDTVNTLLAGYVAAGKTKVEALNLAVKKVVPMYEVKVTKPSLGTQRKTEAGKKAAQAAKQQPAKTKSSTTKSVDMNTVNVAKMSEKDFSKLSAKEKSILRGD